jgi:hypothetical protein
LLFLGESQMAFKVKLLIDSLFDRGSLARDWIDDKGVVDYEAFAWPPDAFAIAATVLRESGAYSQVGRPHDYPENCVFSKIEVKGPKDDCSQPHTRWERFVEEGARHWRSQSYESAKPPSMVRDILDEIGVIARSQSLSGLASPERSNLHWLPFVKLLCLADQTCRGVGVLFPITPKTVQVEDLRNDEELAKRLVTYPYDSIVCRQAGEWLVSQLRKQENDKQARGYSPLTLCRKIDPERAVVLPKMRTSQRGVTIRSLSFHLSLFNGSDVEPEWSPSTFSLLKTATRSANRQHNELPAYMPSDIAEHAGPYNFIVYPWPSLVRPTQFKPLNGPLSCLAGRPCDQDAFFSFEHDPVVVQEFRQDVLSLVKEAESLVGTVHGIILPEMAMTRESFDECFRPEEMQNVHVVIGGVYEKPTSSELLGRNYAVVQRWVQREGEKTHHTVQCWEQDKHHRWALDKSQLSTYALGSTLRLDKTWWEGIDLPKRKVCFFGLDSFTAFTVLICEDLARPDPVGDAVRAVGPNLVICLLMDGPQMATRWSSRYATALCEDPGSSVLTVSSLGMVELSRTRDKLHESSRVVGLWREPEHAPVELTLPPNKKALLLSLGSEAKTEFTLDGRSDSCMSSILRLAGVHHLSGNAARRESIVGEVKRVTRGNGSVVKPVRAKKGRERRGIARKK